MSRTPRLPQDCLHVWQGRLPMFHTATHPWCTQQHPNLWFYVKCHKKYYTTPSLSPKHLRWVRHGRDTFFLATAMVPISDHLEWKLKGSFMTFRHSQAGFYQCPWYQPMTLAVVRTDQSTQETRVMIASLTVWLCPLGEACSQPATTQRTKRPK